MTAGPVEGPFVIDTNVVAAGLLTGEPRAPTARLVAAMLAGRLPFLLSVDLLAEYREVLLRPTLVRRHGLSEDEIERLLQTIAFFARLREPRTTDTRPPDPGDLHLWQLVAAEPGSILVTGDRALREAPAAGFAVLTPADAVDLTAL